MEGETTMKAAIYARVSSDRQDVDLSISAQLKALREYAARNEYVIVKEYVDEAESGKTTNRPQFWEMIAQARRIPKLFDVILVWKYSRFARNREDSIVFKTMLRKAGVQVISINEPLEDTPTGRLLEAMIESLDEFYSANLGEEVTRGMRESASRGFWVASYASYGYRKIMVNDGVKERPKLEIEPSQSSVVQRIFQGVTDGRGLIEIAKELNGEGIVGPRGGSWGKTTIYKILTNEVYVGTLVWGRQSSRNLDPIRVENAVPAIIDSDTFQQAQVRLRERAFINKHPKRVASNYLLSGLARCGYCGKSLIGQDAKGGRFHYYVCGTLQKKGAGSCQAAYTPKERLEREVINKIKEHVLNYENLRELVRNVNDEMDSVARDYSERLNVVLEEIENVSQRLERLYDALETGSLKLADLAPRIQRLRQHQEQLNATRLELEGMLSDRKVELADAEAVKNCIRDLKTMLEESTITERKSFIKGIVREVTVAGSEVTLSYCPPMLAGMMAKETLSVPSIVHGGGLRYQ
jgi:site-specific DNA recombinase